MQRIRFRPIRESGSRSLRRWDGSSFGSSTAMSDHVEDRGLELIGRLLMLTTGSCPLWLIGKMGRPPPATVWQTKIRLLPQANNFRTVRKFWGFTCFI